LKALHKELAKARKQHKQTRHIQAKIKARTDMRLNNEYKHWGE